jgi:hypothetical protein
LDFAFVDTRSVILAVKGLPAVLQVWCFDKSDTLLMGSFALPRITQGHQYVSMQFDGGPPPSLADANTFNGTPFAPAPVPKVLAFSFQVMGRFIRAKHTMIMLISLMFDVLGMRPCDGVELLRRHSYYADKSKHEVHAVLPGSHILKP